MGNQDLRREQHEAASSRVQSNYRYIDGSVSSLAQHTGSWLYPLRTIQDGIESYEFATTQAELSRARWLEIADGTYDEDLLIDVRRNVSLVAQSQWDLGEFQGTGGTQSGTRRNITLTGDGTTINFVGPTFRILTSRSPNRLGPQGTPRVSGQLLSTMFNAGAAVLVECDFWGTNSGKTGMSVDFSGGESGNLIANACIFRGGIDINDSLAWLTDCNLQCDTVDLGAVVLATACDLDVGDMNLSAAFDVTTFDLVTGFINGTNFARAMNYTWLAGALTPFTVDANVNALSKVNGVTLGGGATKVISGDLTP